MHHNIAKDAVINKFQDLMSQFLETQKEVMRAYLNGGDNNLQFPDYETTINTDQTLNTFDTSFQDIPHPDIFQGEEELSDATIAEISPVEHKKRTTLLYDNIEKQKGMNNPPPSTRRFVLTTKNRPLIHNPKSYFKQHGVIITGTADCSLVVGANDKLKSMGYKTLILEHAQELRAPEGERYFADLTDFYQLENTIQTIRKNHGKMSSLIHLAPMSEKKSFEQMALSSWQHQLALETKSLFYLTKILADDLAEAAQKGEASLVAVTAMGDVFASVDSGEKTPEFFPGNGGVSGFIKALAGEIPGINTRVLDLDPADDAVTHIDQITSEFLTPSADIEVGYRSSQRLILDIQETFLNLEKGVPESFKIDKSSVLLITGGGRGITSHIALALAKRFQPTILLVGRIPLDDNLESAETAGITDEKQLKALLAERLKTQQTNVKPLDIGKIYTRLVRQREIRQSLDQLQQAGASACYFSTDVTDESQMKRLMDLLYEEYNRIDGVIHGAGIIEDKMVRDKDIRSFDRVFDTKADSIFILSRLLRSDSLRFLALFSSVAGRFGNPGQSDYGAANEVYNKSALYLNRIWPGRVVSFIWGPWESAGGMVTEELRKKFDTSGIYMIPRDTGAQAFIEEITHGPKINAEVVYGSWDDQKKNLMTTMKNERLPLFCINSNFSPPLNGTVELIRNLEVTKDVYLMDHQLGGQPVLPMAMAMEMMVEAVTCRYPEFQVQAVKDLKAYKEVILEKEQRHIRIVANSNKTTDTEILLKVQIKDAETDKQIYYEAMVELIKEPNVHHPHVPIALQDSAPFSLSVAEAYDKQLFHGPLWHGIESIETIGKNGIIGQLKTSRPENFIQGASSNHSWIIDPLLVDSGLQLILLWIRDQFDITPPPSKFKKYHRFTSEPAPETLRCEIQVNSNGNKGIKEAEIFFISPDGQLFGKIEGFEVIGSKALSFLNT